MSGFDSGVLHSAEQLAKAHSLSITCIPKPFEFDDLKTIIQARITIESGPILRPELSFSVFKLKQAIKCNQLVLAYQLQIDIKSRSLIRVEVLVRWQRPQHGLICPGSFISLTEDNGLIEALTEQVIQQAVSQALSCKSEKMALQMSINISAENIASLTLPEQLSRVLRKHQIDPTMLTFEVTESALMGHANIAHGPEALSIVKTCIMLGHELKFQVVAEGIEDKETPKCISFDLKKIWTSGWNIITMTELIKEKCAADVLQGKHYLMVN